MYKPAFRWAPRLTVGLRPVRVILTCKCPKLKMRLAHQTHCRASLAAQLQWRLGGFLSRSWSPQEAISHHHRLASRERDRKASLQLWFLPNVSHLCHSEVKAQTVNHSGNRLQANKVNFFVCVLISICPKIKCRSLQLCS